MCCRRRLTAQNAGATLQPEASSLLCDHETSDATHVTETGYAGWRAREAAASLLPVLQVRRNMAHSE